MREITTGIDGFAIGLEELIGSSIDGVRAETPKAVAKAARKGAKLVKGYASKGGKHQWSAEYVNGFSSHVTRGEYTTGEIGNKAKPGLVHLLEKGHATINGGRTNAYPHMKPAMGDINSELEQSVSDAVDEGLMQ